MVVQWVTLTSKIHDPWLEPMWVTASEEFLCMNLLCVLQVPYKMEWLKLLLVCAWCPVMD